MENRKENPIKGKVKQNERGGKKEKPKVNKRWKRRKRNGEVSAKSTKGKQKKLKTKKRDTGGKRKK